MVSRTAVLSVTLTFLVCGAFAHPAFSPSLWKRAEQTRSTSDILDALTHYIQRNDVSVDMPVGDSKVTVSARNLNNDEIDFKVKFNNGPIESRKSKLKKVAVPILTFVLLKVITLVPLGLGILGIKAFNALQLSFFSFVISVGLAVFQLCRKFSEQQGPTIASTAWDSRGFADASQVNEAAQSIAYNAYNL